jgi:outer membrane lipoprotein-sorting protein
LTLRSRRGTLACPPTLSNLILAALFSGLVGCTTATVQPVPSEVSSKRWEAGELLSAITQRRDQFRSVRALAQVDYSGPEGKNGFQEAILVQRPDRLRLETLSFLGAIMIVTVDDKEILGYLPREGTFLRGQRSKENLQRFTRIPLELEEITALLLGLPPVDTRTPGQENGNSIVFAASDGKNDRVSFDSNAAVPTKWERFNGNGAVELTARFGDYITTPAGLFPSRINVDAPLQKKKLEIRFQEPELNTTIPAESFSQQKPANVQEVRIEMIGR